MEIKTYFDWAPTVITGIVTWPYPDYDIGIYTEIGKSWLIRWKKSYCRYHDPVEYDLTNFAVIYTQFRDYHDKQQFSFYTPNSRKAINYLWR